MGVGHFLPSTVSRIPGTSLQLPVGVHATGPGTQVSEAQVGKEDLEQNQPATRGCLPEPSFPSEPRIQVSQKCEQGQTGDHGAWGLDRPCRTPTGLRLGGGASTRRAVFS